MLDSLTKKLQSLGGALRSLVGRAIKAIPPLTGENLTIFAVLALFAVVVVGLISCTFHDSSTPQQQALAPQAQVQYADPPPQYAQQQYAQPGVVVQQVPVPVQGNDHMAEGMVLGMMAAGGGGGGYRGDVYHNHTTIVNKTVIAPPATPRYVPPPPPPRPVTVTRAPAMTSFARSYTSASVYSSRTFSSSRRR